MNKKQLSLIGYLLIAIGFIFMFTSPTPLAIMPQTTSLNLYYESQTAVAPVTIEYSGVANGLFQGESFIGIYEGWVTDVVARIGLEISGCFEATKEIMWHTPHQYPYYHEDEDDTRYQQSEDMYFSIKPVKRGYYVTLKATFQVPASELFSKMDYYEKDSEGEWVTTKGRLEHTTTYIITRHNERYGDFEVYEGNSQKGMVWIEQVGNVDEVMPSIEEDDVTDPIDNIEDRDSKDDDAGSDWTAVSIIGIPYMSLACIGAGVLVILYGKRKG